MIERQTGNKTMKHIRIVAIGAGLAFALAGCGTSEQEQPPEPRQAVLSVPTTAQGGNATLTVESGDLEKGTKVSVYAYPLGWDSTENTCTDTDAEKREVVTGSPGTDQNVTFQVETGVTTFVMAGPGFSTPCNAKGSSTVQKSVMDIAVSTPKESIETGSDAGMSVDTRNYYKDEGGKPMDVVVKALGPWQTIPDASAADCAEAPEAQTATVNIKPIEKGNLRANFPLKMQFEKPGVYRLVATTTETERTAAFDSCANETESLVVIK